MLFALTNSSLNNIRMPCILWKNKEDLATCQNKVEYIVYTAKREYLCGDQDYYGDGNEEIVSHSGYHTGYNYGKNLDCLWRIEAPEGWFVQLIPVHFSLEPNER